MYRGFPLLNHHLEAPGTRGKGRYNFRSAEIIRNYHLLAPWELQKLSLRLVVKIPWFWLGFLMTIPGGWPWDFCINSMKEILANSLKVRALQTICLRRIDVGSGGSRFACFLLDPLAHVRWATKKKKLLLSIESWLFNRNPNNGLL